MILVADGPSFLDEQRALLLSYHSVRDVHREQWRLRIMKAECDLMFEQIDVEAEEEEAHAKADVPNSASHRPCRLCLAAMTMRSARPRPTP